MSNIKEGYDRVSDILAMFSDFGSIPQEILERKAAIGTRVHAAITEYIMLGIGEESLEDSDIGYFNSWKNWYHCKHVPTVNPDLHMDIKYSETRLYDDKKMLTGCIDGIWCSAGDHNVLVDWKTSFKENPLVWPLQAALYQSLIYANQLCDIEDMVCFLKLDKNGGDAEEIHYCITEHTIHVADWAVKKYKQEKRSSETIF
jgi:hypothetical protein